MRNDTSPTVNIFIDICCVNMDGKCEQNGAQEVSMKPYIWLTVVFTILEK